MQTMVQTCADQQRQHQHQGDKSAHAVPAVAVPEYAAERTGNTGSQIIAEQIQEEARPLARFARGPIQLLCYGGARQKPAEKSSIPAKISHSDVNRVINSPTSITPVEKSITGPRP